MKRSRHTCMATRKRRYRDHAQAVRALQKFKATSTRDRVPVRAYECDHCKGWHVTSQATWGETRREPRP